MVVTNTSNSMKKKIFLMRSPEVMRAGTGNKNIILCGLSGQTFIPKFVVFLHILVKLTTP